MLPSFATDTITVIHPSLVDDRGTPSADYDNPVSRVEILGCSVQPGASDEDLLGRTQETIRYTVYAPPGSDITAQSAVEFDGERFAVDGRPDKWRSPTGAVSHMVVLLIDWRG